ncbi:hypothetical protein [Micromonospora sp. WMMD1082]|uniref:hypothetical protein n=1 Tax=Micromonospora sp. WMMD1082 TaxID=3016104 RepID=UPI002417C227|nr:hypothetical protein [Micromonospora sp. WMMD1082]MDG4795424.1 hypothetical protein [Micromonospora sp. WMMD1082]
MPPQARYAFVPNLGPTILTLSATACVTTALLILGRRDAAELTAARILWPYHLVLIATVTAAVFTVAAVACRIIGTWWFFLPTARAALLCTALALAAATVMPARFTAVAPLLYLLFCYYIGRGDTWWDLILAHPSPTNFTASALLALLAILLFITLGPRRLHPYDEPE